MLAPLNEREYWSTPMYAVIETGGKQYKVEQGATIEVEKLAGEPGEKVTFDKVLLVGGGSGGVSIGSPTVSSAKVTGEIVNQGRSKKVLIFKFKRRKDYRRKAGHRQSFTAVKISGISA